MVENKFQEYYKAVRERDQHILEETQLPDAEGINVCALFGLTLGIGSIVLGFFTVYSAAFAVIGLILSALGYKKPLNRFAVPGMITSIIGFIISIGLAALGNPFLEELNIIIRQYFIVYRS